VFFLVLLLTYSGPFHVNIERGDEVTSSLLETITQILPTCHSRTLQAGIQTVIDLPSALLLFCADHVRRFPLPTPWQ
jgi:hypothetical protein